jgi:hypothetical protein
MMSWRKVWVVIVVGALSFIAAWHFRGDDSPACGILAAFGYERRHRSVRSSCIYRGVRLDCVRTCNQPLVHAAVRDRAGVHL